MMVSQMLNICQERARREREKDWGVARRRGRGIEQTICTRSRTHEGKRLVPRSRLVKYCTAGHSDVLATKDDEHPWQTLGGT